MGLLLWPVLSAPKTWRLGFLPGSPSRLLGFTIMLGFNFRPRAFWNFLELWVSSVRRLHPRCPGLSGETGGAPSSSPFPVRFSRVEPLSGRALAPGPEKSAGLLSRKSPGAAAAQTASEPEALREARAGRPQLPLNHALPTGDGDAVGGRSAHCFPGRCGKAVAQPHGAS